MFSVPLVLASVVALAPSVAAPPSPVATPRTIPRPESDDHAMWIAAGVFTGVGWISRSISIGLGMRYPGFCTFGPCDDPSRSTAWRVFTYAPPFFQLAATASALPGGVVEGRLYAWREVTSGKPRRRGRALAIAGGVLFGVFTATSIALRPAVLLQCFSGTGGCENATSYVAYSLAAQSSDTLSTIGAGMLGYGIGYRRARMRYASTIAVAAWSSRGVHGVAMRGRF